VELALGSVLNDQASFKKLSVVTNVHRTTLMRAAKDKASERKTPIYYDKRSPKEQLTARNKERRIEFANMNRQREWDRVMFTDRKRFYFQYPGTPVSPSWCIKGTRREAFRPSAPSCLNIYLGITPHGVTACHAVTGTTHKEGLKYHTQKGALARNITSQEYYYVLMKTLLPEGQRLFKGQPWILQQDGDRSHSAASHSAVGAYNRCFPETQIVILPQWPANSPDLSPIENLWAVVEAKANALGCKTFDEYRSSVVQLIQETPQSHLSNYYRSMKGRLLECIKEGGSRINH
jgi:hypothetical protein